MTTSIKYQTKVHFRCGPNGRKHLETGAKPDALVEPGRVPRIARLMALAIRFDGLIRDGVVTDQAELARLGHVTRARLTQIMNLLHLAKEATSTPPTKSANLIYLSWTAIKYRDHS